MRIRIIDAHVHLVPKNNRYGPDFDLSIFDIREKLADKRVDGIVLIPTLYQSDNSVEVNKAFLALVSKSSLEGKLYPLVWLHPHQADRELAEHTLVKGIKFHPSISQERIDRASDILELASRTRKPILVHCGRSELSHIKYVLEASDRFADVDFVCAHMGGLANELIVAALDLVKRHQKAERIFLDTSGCFNPKLLKKAVQLLGADHVIFGSDAPFFDLGISLYVIRSCGFDKTTLKRILFETAMSVYHINHGKA